MTVPELKEAIISDPKLFLKLYHESGLLDIYMPEVVAMQGVEQPAQFHSEGDVFEHTRLVLNNLPSDATPELKMATLLHDIGKAKTFQSAEETGDRIRFNGHDKVSAEMAEEILTRLKFESVFVRKVRWLVENHMKILTAFAEMKVVNQKKMIRGKLNTPKAIEDSIALFDSLVSLAIADAYSSLKENGEPDMSEIEKLREAVRPAREAVINDISKETEAKESGKTLHIIDGKQVAELFWKAFNLDSDKKYAYLIGEIIDAIREAYNRGEIKNFFEAEEYAKFAIAEAKSKIESVN